MDPSKSSKVLKSYLMPTFDGKQANYTHYRMQLFSFFVGKGIGEVLTNDPDLPAK